MATTDIPSMRLTLDQEQIQQLIERCTDVRHVVRNHLMIIGAHTALCRLKAVPSEQEHSLEIIDQQGKQIDQCLTVFSELLKRTCQA